MKYITTIDEKEFVVDIVDDHHVVVNDKVFEVDFESVSGQPLYSLLINGQSHEAYVYAAGDEWQVLLLGRQYPVKVENEREKRLRGSAGGKVQEFRGIPIESADAGSGGRNSRQRRTAN